MFFFNDTNINKLTLSFKDQREKDYQAYYFKTSLNIFRIAFLFVALLYGLFGFLDSEIAQEHLELFYIIRFWIVVPLLLSVFVLSFLKIFEKIWQWLLFISFIIGGWGIIVMIVKMPENTTYYAGLMLVFSAGYFLIKLRFIFATLAGWLTLISFIIAVIWYSDITYELIIAYSFFYISANLISMVAAYYIEFFDRNNYLLTNQLNQKKAELEESNKNLESEVKLRTQALAESEKKFRTLVEKASDIIYSISSDGIISYVSPNWTALLGHDIEEVQGKKFIDFIHSDDVNNYLNFLRKITEPDKKQNYVEYRVQNKNGNWRWHVSSATPQFGEDGKVISYIGIAHDISERKQAEKAVIESQRLSAIGEMASAVAHDFNNSLQAISGNLELALLKPSIPKEIKKYLATIQTSATDAATRVQLLQRFAGKKKNASNYQPVKLNKVIADVIVQARPMWKDEMEANGLHISIETGYEDIPEILGNEGELRSVFYNVVKNSIEAMPKGGKIIFETGVKENNVFVHIIDTGIGMNEEAKTRLFQPFFTTKGFEAGRGLGMSGAYSIIQEHKGNIKILETATNQGTAIEISLPLTIKENSLEADEIKGNSFKKGNILWVDDDVMIREIAGEMLQVLGHNGVIAENGFQALELLNNKKFDLVITDIGMPDMSGWLLAEKIKEKYFGKIKVAVITGWNKQLNDEDKMKYGVDYILVKPIKLANLKSLINNALSSE